MEALQAGRLAPLLLDFGHQGMRRSTLQPVQEVFQLVARTFSHDLHPTIGQVLDAPPKPQVQSPGADEVAVADTLDPAPDYRSQPFAHRCRNYHLPAGRGLSLHMRPGRSISQFFELRPARPGRSHRCSDAYSAAS